MCDPPCISVRERELTYYVNKKNVSSPNHFILFKKKSNSNIHFFEFTPLPHDFTRVNGHRLVDEGYQRVVLATGVLKKNSRIIALLIGLGPLPACLPSISVSSYPV